MALCSSQGEHGRPTSSETTVSPVEDRSVPGTDWGDQELNDRPRKRLAFKKPIELIGDLLLR